MQFNPRHNITEALAYSAEGLLWLQLLALPLAPHTQNTNTDPCKAHPLLLPHLPAACVCSTLHVYRHRLTLMWKQTVVLPSTRFSATTKARTPPASCSAEEGRQAAAHMRVGNGHGKGWQQGRQVQTSQGWGGRQVWCCFTHNCIHPQPPLCACVAIIKQQANTTRLLLLLMLVCLFTYLFLCVGVSLLQQVQQHHSLILQHTAHR